jgi:hypothetical protein
MQRILFTLLFVSLIGGIVGLLAFASDKRMSGETQIAPVIQDLSVRSIKKVTYESEPLKISSLEIANKKIQIDDEFYADDNWLRDLEVEVENVSGKTITSFELIASVRIKNRDKPVGLVLNFNTRKEISYQPDSGLTARHIFETEKTEYMPSFAKVKTRIPAWSYEFLIRQLRDKDTLSNINKATIFISSVIFEDKTGWAGGRLLKQNPNQPNIWNIPTANNLENLKSNFEIDKSNLLRNSGTKESQKLAQKPTLENLCYCGTPQFEYRICCETYNPSCAVSGNADTLSCYGDESFRCCPFDLYECECFPGTQCTSCMYVQCGTSCL